MTEPAWPSQRRALPVRRSSSQRVNTVPMAATLRPGSRVMEVMRSTLSPEAHRNDLPPVETCTARSLTCCSRYPPPDTMERTGSSEGLKGRGPEAKSRRMVFWSGARPPRVSMFLVPQQIDLPSEAQPTPQTVVPLPASSWTTLPSLVFQT